MGGSLEIFRDPSSTGFTRVNLTAGTFLTDRSLLLRDGKGAVRILRTNKLTEVCQLPTDAMTRQRIKAVARGNSVDGGVVAFTVGMSDGRVEIWSAKTAIVDSTTSGGDMLEAF